MSIWSDLLSLHGYVIRPHNDDAEPARPRPVTSAEADHLRELIGCRAPSTPRPEPKGPLLGVHGLA
ncbi:MAG TPA: hypothetical protein VGF31_02260 [Myxococcaceae bacterium]|jgi:hypothetical protein